MKIDSIKNRLNAELKKRNSRLMIPHFFVLAFSSFVFKEIPLFLPYVIIVASLLLRILVLKSGPKFFPSYLFFVATTGLPWGYLFHLSFEHYGFFSIETLYCMGIIITLMAGGVTAFAASFKTVLTYLVSISAIPIFVLLTDQASSAYIIGILLVGDLLYLLYVSTVSHQYILESASQNASMQEFIDSIPGLVVFINKNQDYVLVNNFQDGFFKEKLLNQKLGALFPDSSIVKILEDFISSNEVTSVHEVMTTDLGVESWYMVNLRKVSIPQFGIIAAIFPIDELVKAKSDLRIQEARSQYASKLASLGEMSAGIAHEVNNPLTIIEGAAGIMKLVLKDQAIDIPTLERSTSKILETTGRIAKIVKSLRTLSGEVDEDPFKSVSFRAIVEPSLEISKARLDTFGINLSVDYPENEVELFGNEIQLSQVILNLVCNALDAIKELHGEKWIKITFRINHEWVDIFVIDNGPGIAPENREKIMEPFFTTKSSDQGTGLGLSISKSFAENHQGSLTLLPDTKHTTFRLRLPRMGLWSNSKKNTGKVGSIVARK